MVATAIYSVTMVLWKETAFRLRRDMERRWKTIVVVCDSGDTPANCYNYYYYAVFNVPCSSHKDVKSQAQYGCVISWIKSEQGR